jgi:glucokinase
MDVIAGDIGGTNTRLALVTLSDGRAHIRTEARYPSADYASLEAIVARFVAEHGGAGRAACFAVAGPVEDGVCRVTNLPWVVTAPSLAAVTGGAVRVVNDFEAAATGVDRVAPEHLVTLQDGVVRPRAPRAVLGAGTGLGEALCVWVGDRYQSLPTEGGHTDLAARNDDEEALLRWLRARHGHVSYERVVSGPGLAAVYEHLRERDPAAARVEVSDALLVDDPAAVISRHAAAGDDALCARAFDLWAGVYGAEAGNLALKSLARGGVYLAGGIAARVLPRLRASPFLEAFRDKGRMRPLVESMALRVVTEPALGLLGAAACAEGGH